jgi:glucose/arabinose dehydrogenase
VSRRVTTILVLAACSVLVACTSDAPEPQGGRARPSSSLPRSPAKASPTHPPSQGAPTRRDLRRVKLRLVRVAKIPEALALATRPGDDTLYVGTRVGRVLALRDGVVQKKPVLNISERISLEGEQGFLSLTFSPQGDRLYVSYTDSRSQGWVQSYEIENGIVDDRSRENVLRIDQPTIRHQGGHITFGPDGHLWVAFGDGSLGDDPDDNAQTLSNLHGKLLRIHPTPDGARSYVVPDGNPFRERPGTRPEIYGYGLRNPWRFSFDMRTGDLWIGDVGQYILEEIDYLRSGAPAGTNFGWNRLEGTRSFSGVAPKKRVDPIAEYNHDDGRCAVIGGHVYRGKAIPELYGAYLYGDFCDGRVRALVQKQGRVAHEADLGLHISGLVSFAQLPDGEILVLSLSDGVFRIEAARQSN